MANIKTCLEEVMRLEGAAGVVLLDLKSGKTLGTAGDSPNLDIEAAANADIVKAKFKVLAALDRKDTVEDILITQGQRYHLLRCIGGAQGMMLFLNLYRRQGDPAHARIVLSQIESELMV